MLTIIKKLKTHEKVYNLAENVPFENVQSQKK